MNLDTLAPDLQELVCIERARGLHVTDEPSAKLAGEFLLEMKALRREIDDTFDAPIAAAYRAHRTALDAKRRHCEPIQRAERIVKQSLAEYVANEKARIEAIALNTSDLTPAVIHDTPKVPGISFAPTVQFEVHDFMALVVEVACGRAPLDLLMANERNIRTRLTKGEGPWPGVTTTEGQSVRVRG